MGMCLLADSFPVDSSYLQYGALGVLAILLILLTWVGMRLISSAETQRKLDAEVKEKEMDIQEKRFDKIVDAIDRQTTVFVSRFDNLQKSVASACNYEYRSSNGHDTSIPSPAHKVSDK